MGDGPNICKEDDEYLPLLEYKVSVKTPGLHRYKMESFKKAVTGFYNNISTSVTVDLSSIFSFVYQVVLDKDFE